ncbi:DUF3159 domain-containing protein [Cellulomonas sp. P24]|uniref:DUF3159 domain-containing protein n=1 Tax=Cellulomonas sp. P24 TaxID=2885206 RepID=UPI00216B05A7|nr:DUF3159 domain-containing protein [Cellulomonas sp. P24]MCR6494259.1 DUF3159 domain-containing protein [Cellulomonas sp. P24]
MSERGLRAIAADDFSVSAAVGGVRGLIESVLPGLVFVVAFVATSDLSLSLIVSIAGAAVAVVLRLVQGTPVTQAMSGILGVGIGVVWAWRSGESKNFFAWGLWVNAGWSAGALVSILARWPGVGVIVALVRGDGMGWRTDPDAGALRRAYTWATWIWVVLFGLRLLVQVPLYLDSTVGWLGTAKLVMGVPLFAVGLWLSWLLVRPRAGAPAPSRPPLDP